MQIRPGNILIVDDDRDVLFSARMLLKDHFYKVHTLSDPGKLTNVLNDEEYDIVLLDMNYSGSETSGNQGINLLEQVRQLDPRITVVMMTAFGNVDLAIKAVKRGATDFVVKPWQNEKLVATLSSALALSKSNQEVARLQTTQKQLAADIDMKFGSFIGESNRMKKIFELITKVAATDANILILGENGTGKELVAHSIHRQSIRKNHGMVTVDLGAINENLFEGELFGHVKGAYTDARDNRAGRFEMATGSTLFLDEIGNIPLTLQSKLLTVLQNRQVVRLGANKQIPIDIRLICATNLPIYERVEDGSFREDLLYRIKTIEIQLPPLRERAGDIALLAAHFLNVYCKKYRKPPMKLNQESLEKLERYSWPGNVRELQHVVERAVILSDNKILKPMDFPVQDIMKKGTGKTTSLKLEDIELETIKTALETHSGNISRAANSLGLTRAALYRRMEKYDIK